ncbi:indole-3-glycerol-phosphate synthase [Archaeoglobus neptunius]|uniref:indole-3-glycerol-phosphate synthase n=1 Tax=Archaeoglobus neptunius TaxID=2798580 RepID=UPI0019291E9B|nr:indole-3-glycerol-phosphate synthase TrpC [Archaeoglobus neptunius]
MGTYLKSGFINSLKSVVSSGRNAVIAEIKPYSPIHGDLMKGRDVEDILQAYFNAGAAAISYITAADFGGSFETLRKICHLSELPVLRKDFIRDAAEIERSAGADVSALLLVARHLKDRTDEMVDLCFEHGIEPVVEVHHPEDLPFARNADVVLINNRDIDRMETDSGDVSVTARIAQRINCFKISGSGIGSIEDLLFVLNYADAALIGTAFMMADDTERFVRAFVEAKR